MVYLNTFSQTISPSLRVGYMVLPRKLVQRYDSRLGFYSCTVPTFEQLLLAELIGRGDFERHVNRVRRGKRQEARGEARGAIGSLAPSAGLTCRRCGTCLGPR